MFRRISPLGSKTAIVGLAVFWWTMLAHGSTAQFALWLTGTISKWLDGHAWAGFLAGLGLIAAALVWPELRPRFAARLKIPKTTQQRVKEVEERLTALDHVASESQDIKEGLRQALNLQNQFAAETGKINNNFAERIKTLEGDRTKAIEERSEISLRIHQLGTRTRSLEGILQSSSTFCRYLFDINELLRQAEDNITTLRRMMDMYGDLSPVVRQPFSAWRLPPHSLDPAEDDSIRDGERWARSLEEYVTRAQGFSQGWYGDFFYGDLINYVTTWRTTNRDTTADDLLKILMDHRETLLKLRKDYATSFISGGLAGATAS